MSLSSLEPRKKYQIVRYAPLGMTPTRVKFGSLTKWTPTMCQLGVRVVRVILKIAKCCARPIIAQKAIDKFSRIIDLRELKRVLKY